MQGSMRLLAPWLCALLLPQVHAARVVTLADLAVGTDDNIQASRDGLPRSVEQWLQAGIATALSGSVADGLSLRLQARADGRLHARHEGLNEITVGIDGLILMRPGRGFHTPTIGLSMGIGSSQFDSDLRDAQEARLRLTLREALTTRIAARGSMSASWRGSDSQAFDAYVKGGELAFDWQATAPLTLTMAYQYREGQVVSIGQPGVSARRNASAIEPDDVFVGQMAFSFPAQTHIGLLGASYALGSGLSLDAQLRYVESDTRFNTRYHRWSTTTGLSARF